MTAVAPSSSKLSSRLPKPPVLVAAAVMAALVLAAISRPNLALLFQAKPVIQVHVYAAFSALLLGAALMSWRKGRTFHRVAGWVFVVLMTMVAGASLFITELNPGHWSLIHLLSGWTLISIPAGVYFARRHQVKNHRRNMMGLFYGGLIIAGGFTFVPGRLMFQVFFGH